MNERDDSNFSEYRRLILDRLDDLREDVKDLSKEMRLVEAQLLTLKVRAGLWGATAGVIPILIAAVVAYLRSP
jgi:hypothetical protein